MNLKGFIPLFSPRERKGIRGITAPPVAVCDPSYSLMLKKIFSTPLRGWLFCARLLLWASSHSKQAQKKTTAKAVVCRKIFFGAEREGFEPPEHRCSTVFKTAAFDHSAIFPMQLICPQREVCSRKGNTFFINFNFHFSIFIFICIFAGCLTN